MVVVTVLVRGRACRGSGRSRRGGDDDCGHGDDGAGVDAVAHI